MIPPGLMVNRARSRSKSTPICAPGSTTTFLSKIAFRTIDLSPIRTYGISTEPSTIAPRPTETS